METPSPTRTQRILLGLLRRAPRRLLARWLGRLTRVPLPTVLRRPVWGRLGRWLAIDLAEARDPDPRSYRTFEALFTRTLRPDARPLEGLERDAVCPVDGTLSGSAPVGDGTLAQAKGRSYALEALLATPGSLATFRGGSYATLYLAPRDYHRIHAPLAFRVQEVVHVPGTCYPVFPAAVRDVEALFVQNERVVVLGADARTECPLALVAVAAFGVGNIRLPWLPRLATNRAFTGRTPRRHRVDVNLARGAELGTFALGSTVVVVLGPGSWAFRDAGPCRMGERLATTPVFPAS